MDVEALSSEAMSPQLTEIGDFERQTEGYIAIVPLPEETKSQIYAIQRTLTSAIPSQQLWLPRDDQLHVTFAHIVSPDAEYARDRSEIFGELQSKAQSSLEHVAGTVRGDKITFDQLKIFPGAVILEGSDDGTMAAARDQFSNELSVPEGTRKPPAIIHTTIARFREQIPIENVQAALEGVVPNFAFEADSLQLIQEHAMYTQSHSVIREFK